MKREHGRLHHDLGRLRWSVLLESSAHACICSCKGEDERLSGGRRSDARRTENGTDGIGQTDARVTREKRRHASLDQLGPCLVSAIACQSKLFRARLTCPVASLSSKTIGGAVTSVPYSARLPVVTVLLYTLSSYTRGGMIDP